MRCSRHEPGQIGRGESPAPRQSSRSVRVSQDLREPAAASCAGFACSPCSLGERQLHVDRLDGQGPIPAGGADEPGCAGCQGKPVSEVLLAEVVRKIANREPPAIARAMAPNRAQAHRYGRWAFVPVQVRILANSPAKRVGRCERRNAHLRGTWGGSCPGMVGGRGAGPIACWRCRKATKGEACLRGRAPRPRVDLPEGGETAFALIGVNGPGRDDAPNQVTQLGRALKGGIRVGRARQVCVPASHLEGRWRVGLG